MRRVLGRALFAAMGVVTAFVPVTGVQAAGASYAAGSNTHVMLSVSPAHGGPRAVWLACDPARGSHPDAARACAVLAGAGGNPAAITDREGVCPMMYEPVRVRATGRWHGKAVHYRETFGNACVMDLGTDELFRF